MHVVVLRRGDRGPVPGVGGRDAAAARAGRAARARRAAAAPLPLRHAVTALRTYSLPTAGFSRFSTDLRVIPKH